MVCAYAPTIRYAARAQCSSMNCRFASGAQCGICAARSPAGGNCDEDDGTCDTLQARSNRWQRLQHRDRPGVRTGCGVLNGICQCPIRARAFDAAIVRSVLAESSVFGERPRLWRRALAVGMSPWLAGVRWSRRMAVVRIEHPGHREGLSRADRHGPRPGGSRRAHDVGPPLPTSTPSRARRRAS
jgi:hypothetical protein